ncbi:MAG: tetratricopeptide repeat protein [Candidatus Hodarchaeales archaeon]|jgi:tetratricopeptide (TPR) repeat protein
MNSLLNQIKLLEELIRNSDLNIALNKVKNLEKLEKNESLYSEVLILKSKILQGLGNTKEAKKLAEMAFLTSKSLNDMVLEFKSRIAILNTKTRLENVARLVLFDKINELWIKIPAEVKPNLKLSESDFYYLSWNVFYFNGEIKKALELASKYLILEEEIGNSYTISRAKRANGFVLYKTGEFEQALSLLNQSLDLIQNDRPKSYLISVVLGDIGEIYQWKGEFDRALESFNLSISNAEKSKNKNSLGLAYFRLGNFYQIKGDLDEAIKVFKLAEMAHPERNFVDSSYLYFALVKIYLEKKNVDLAEINLLKLKEINELTKNSIINFQYSLANALCLINKPRLKEKIQAQTILENLVKHEIIDSRLHTITLKELCRILLLEFKSTEELEVLSEVREKISYLQEIAKKYYSFSLQIEVLILKSKIAYLEDKVDESEKYLSEAMKIADEKQLNNLKIQLESEKSLLTTNLDLELGKIQLKEKIKQSQILEYMEQARILVKKS